MKWHIVFPLLIAIPAVILASPFDEDADEGELPEFARERRIPYMLPQNFFYMRRFMGPNYSRQDASNDEDDMMMRKRSSLSYQPDSVKLQFWRDILADPSEAYDADNDEDDDDLDFDRRRRSPSLYPRGFKKRMDLMRPIAKRGIPYYFPIFHYKPYYPLHLRGMKRFFARKRTLADAFTRDDLGSFGYDKRAEQKRSDGEDDEDSKRKKKAI